MLTDYIYHEKKEKENLPTSRKLVTMYKVLHLRDDVDRLNISWKEGERELASIKSQQNSKCWSCGDKDETINHIINECSKLAQNMYKTRHDWVGKVIKVIKFDHKKKWYMPNQASVLENDKHKLLWDFDMQTDH